MKDDSWEEAARSFAFGPFVLFPERQLLLKGEQPVRIGGRALDLLTALIERPGELVSKGELIARAWPDLTVDESNLKVNMAAVRRALGEEAGAAEYIATVARRGYRFVGAVQASGPTTQAVIPAPTAAPGLDLPREMTRILGRADEIEAVLHDLEASRVVSIVGAGGIGKTTLAVTAAHALARTLADGAAFIDLGTIGDAQFIPAVITAGLGIGLTGGDPLAAVVNALRTQQKLLVFDNCEHMLPDVAATVDRLARHLDHVRILATSREPLRIRDELVHRLSGLKCDPRDRPTVDEARTYPAIDLFAMRASERAGYMLTDSDAPAVVQICRRLDGNALAIELAATQTSAFAPERILQMLDDSLRLLTLGPPGAPARQQSLIATLDWSYSLLSPGQAAVLRAISVFAGAFNVKGAEAVSGRSPPELVDLLAQLVAKSLLTMDASGQVVSYRLLETTRGYCVERLRATQEDQAVRRRHAEHICAVLEQAGGEWSLRPAREWAAAYGHVVDDLRAALAWSGRDTSNRALRIRLTVAGLLLWNHFSLIEECHGHVARAVDELEAEGLLGTAFEMKFKLWLGASTMITRGLKPQALEALRRAWEIANEIGDTDYRHRSLMLIAAFELFTAQYGAGMRTIETFASVASADDPSILPEGEVHLGIAELFLGRLPDALRRLQALQQRDVRYFNGSYSVRYLADIVVLLECALSQVQWLTGSPDAAARTAMVAYERARPAHHHLSLNNALTYSCPVFYWSGLYEQCGKTVDLLSEHVARQGLITRRPIADFYRAALAYSQSGPSDGAIDGLERAIEEFKKVNYLARLPYYQSVLADALLHRGRLGEAEATIEAALDFAHAMNEGWCIPEIRRIQAAILIAQGRSDDAEALLLEAIRFARKIGALSWQLRAAVDLATHLRDQARIGEARKMLRGVYDAFREGFATRDLVVAADLLAGLEREPVKKRQAFRRRDH